MNKAIIIGRSTRDVDLRYTPNGVAVAKLNIAVDRKMSNEKKQEAENNGLPTADFINVVAWRGTAEYLANFLSKGKMVAVSGSIQTGRYEKDGQTIYTTEIAANEVNILEWGDKKETQDTPDGFHPTDNDVIPF